MLACLAGYNLQLVFRRRLSAGDMVRIPGLIGQSVHCAGRTVDSHLSGLDRTFGTFNADLLGRIGSQRNIIIQVDMVRFGSVGIRFRSHRRIFAVRYFRGGTGCRFFQLADIDGIGICLACRYIGDLLAACINSRLGNAGAVLDLQPVLVDCHCRVSGTVLNGKPVGIHSCTACGDTIQ